MNCLAGSLWACVLVHWFPVSLWLLLLGGEQRRSSLDSVEFVTQLCYQASLRRAFSKPAVVEQKSWVQWRLLTS